MENSIQYVLCRILKYKTAEENVSLKKHKERQNRFKFKNNSGNTGKLQKKKKQQQLKLQWKMYKIQLYNCTKNKQK